MEMKRKMRGQGSDWGSRPGHREKSFIFKLPSLSVNSRSTETKQQQKPRPSSRRIWWGKRNVKMVKNAAAIDSRKFRVSIKRDTHCPYKWDAPENKHKKPKEFCDSETRQELNGSFLSCSENFLLLFISLSMALFISDVRGNISISAFFSLFDDTVGIWKWRTWKFWKF